MTDRTLGIVYVAYGELARREAAMSIETLRMTHRLPLSVISDGDIPFTKRLKFADPRWGARWAKLNIDLLSPYDDTLYIDADTRVRGDLMHFFSWLEDGFDLVIGASAAQGDKTLWHVTEAERDCTLDEIGFTPIQLQAGLFAFRKNGATASFFKTWRDAYESVEGAENDQAALLRALYAAPLHYHLLSKPYCDQTIAHLFGKLRERQ